MADSVVPHQDRVIPHSEHPEAYGSGNVKKIKFIEPFPLYSRKTSPSRRSSDALTFTCTPSSNVSSTASVRSFASIVSPILATNNDSLQDEARRHEYEFEQEEGELSQVFLKGEKNRRMIVLDFRNVQELLMGKDVKLTVQLPVQLVTFKRYEEKRSSKQANCKICDCGNTDDTNI